MSANHAEDIVIPSVFIGEYNGVLIIESYLYPQNYALIITDDVPFNINNNLIIPFAIVVGLSFIIMVSELNESNGNTAHILIGVCPHLSFWCTGLLFDNTMCTRASSHAAAPLAKQDPEKDSHREVCQGNAV